MPTSDDPNEDQAGKLPGEASQHDYVTARRPDPATPPTSTIELTGMFGDSDRPGYRRLYFTRDLLRYAEFRAEDVVGVEEVPADRPPLVGVDAVMVSVRRDAPIEFTRLRVARPLDEFDLDVRLGGENRANFDIEPPSGIIVDGVCIGGFTDRCGPGGGGGGDATRPVRCDTPTDAGPTCVGTCTCFTQCNQVTCAGTCTCFTQCNQNTCGGATCAGTCGETCRGATCAGTCGETCRGATCRGTCATCNPRIPDCQGVFM